MDGSFAVNTHDDRIPGHANPHGTCTNIYVLPHGVVASQHVTLFNHGTLNFSTVVAVLGERGSLELIQAQGIDFSMIRDMGVHNQQMSSKKFECLLTCSFSLAIYFYGHRYLEAPGTKWLNKKCDTHPSRCHLTYDTAVTKL